MTEMVFVWVLVVVIICIVAAIKLKECCNRLTDEPRRVPPREMRANNANIVTRTIRAQPVHQSVPTTRINLEPTMNSTDPNQRISVIFNTANSYNHRDLSTRYSGESVFMSTVGEPKPNDEKLYDKDLPSYEEVMRDYSKYPKSPDIK